MPKPAATFTDAELRRIRSAVEDGTEPLDAIGTRFRRSRKTIVALIAKYGWNCPAQNWQKKKGPQAKRNLKRVQANRYLVNPAKYVAQKRQEVQAVDRELYGPLLDDVQWLRRRGWAINREGMGYRVGNSVIDGAALAEKAARERRLAGGV